ncbi:MAG: restriction endonuclease [Patescibacteria group bacterium]
MSILIAKADGTLEPFDERKLVTSLSRSGADTAAAYKIARDITATLQPGTTTAEIYRRAFMHLREHKRGVAARYSLKRAILDFGPSGFPFESYLAKLFEAEGWATRVDQIIQGRCVEHEVDVVMTKGEETVYVEAKFHNTAGFKTDLKTVLYVMARLEDIGKGRGMVVTNTKFTTPALQYSSCRGLELLGWEYPQGKNLHDRIDAAKLYPVTALTTLGRREKMSLLSERVVLCRALSEDTRALATAGITGKKADEVLREVGSLCIPGTAI